MRTTTLIQKLNGGEMTPYLDGLVGFDKYPSGCRILENMIALAQGPVTKRPGTHFAAEVKDSADRTALIPFEFSTVQAYMIEVGDQYLRFYKDNGAILEAALTITGATQANPVVVTYTGTDPADGDDVVIADVVGMTELNGRRFRLANVNAAANTAELTDLAGNDIDGTGFTAYTSGGTMARVYTIAAPWALADLFDADGRCRLKYAQSADTMYLAHPSYAPRKLTRTGHTNWTISTVAFLDGPYLDENTTATTLTPAATTGTGITVTASGTTGINAGAGFKSTDVGRLLRIGHPATGWATSTAYVVGDLAYANGNVYTCVTAGTSAASSSGPSGEGAGIVDGTAQWDFQNTGGLVWGYGKIASVTDTENVDVDIVNAFGGTGARTTWRLGAWSDTDGWPSAVGFHEERLLWGGAGFNPQRLDGSKTNDFENLAPGVNDDDPISFAIASDQVNAIRWFASAHDLLIGTLGAEGRVFSPNNQPITPTAVTVRLETRHGCADMLPETIGNAVLFVQRAGRKVRETSFDLQADGYKAPDMTELADHVTGDGLVDLAYQQEPFSVLWAPRTDGQLCGFTYWRDEDVTPWHRHILGGAFGDGAAVVEAVSCIPTATADQLWLIVKRTLQDRTVRTVEYLEVPLGHDLDQADAFYVDCGLSYDGSPTTTLSNLWHLEGATVKVCGDGAVFPDAVVTDGKITLSKAVSKAAVGLGYRARVKPMRIQGGAQAGTSEGQMKRIDSISARFYRTLGCSVGRSETAGEFDDIPFRDASMDMGVAPPLFTGDKPVTFPGAYDTDSPMIFFSDDPTPLTLVSIAVRFSTNEG